MVGSAIQYTEPATAQLGTTEPSAKTSAAKIVTGTAAQEPVIAQLVIIAIISVVNVSNVQTTHLEKNAKNLVIVTRMELLSVLTSMADVSVRQIGLAQDAKLTALLAILKEIVLNT
jgi:hypothetical protein